MSNNNRYVDSVEQLVTEIFVRDITVSKGFYQRLGFEMLRDDGNFIELAWEGHLLFLAERKDMPDHPNVPLANIRIMVPNVDDYWKMAGEIGATVVNPITDRAYGLRDFTIADPDGFALRFATRLNA